MKLSQVFSKAKANLDHQYPHGICTAIDDTNDVDEQSKARAKEIIHSRINGGSHATSWLASTVIHGTALSPDTATDDQFDEVARWKVSQSREALQAWRHAWLDQLITEFKEKEKSQCKSRTTATSK